MNFEKTAIDGVVVIKSSPFSDMRGLFVKTFQRSVFSQLGLEHDFSESYYTYSKRDVIRGMHYQAYPHEHAKLVTIVHGRVEDVILDLRKSSRTVGKYITIELSGENQKSIYIPRGCAHGFRVVDEAAIVYYLVTSEYAPEHDKGIRYDSFGYDWKVTNPIVSERDLQFPRLAEYGGIFR